VFIYPASAAKHNKRVWNVKSHLSATIQARRPRLSLFGHIARMPD